MIRNVVYKANDDLEGEDNRRIRLMRIDAVPAGYDRLQIDMERIINAAEGKRSWMLYHAHRR